MILCTLWLECQTPDDLTVLLNQYLLLNSTDYLTLLIIKQCCFFWFFFSKVTGVNHKIKFPAPRAHPVALRLACPMSKPGLVTPRRAQAQGPSVLSGQ